jgi:hypothetical protein
MPTLKEVFAELEQAATAPMAPDFRQCAHIERLEFGATFSMQPPEGLVRVGGTHFRDRRFAGRRRGQTIQIWSSRSISPPPMFVGVIGCITFGACMENDEVRRHAFDILLRDLGEQLMIALRDNTDIFPPPQLKPIIKIGCLDELLEVAAAARSAENDKSNPSLH